MNITNNNDELISQIQTGNTGQDLPYHNHDGVNSKQISFNNLLNQPTLNSLLPSQTGNSGKVLTTDGTDTSWGGASGKLNIWDQDDNFTISANDSVEYNLRSATLPGGTLGTGNIIHIVVDMDTTTLVSAAPFNIKLVYGSTTIISIQILNSTGGNITVSGRMEFYLYGAGATNAQEASFAGWWADGNATNSSQIVAITNGTSSIDSTSDQTLAVKVGFNAANAGQQFKATNCLVEIKR